MKAYFKYLVKTKWLQTIVLALIPTFIFLLILANSPFYPEESRDMLVANFGVSVIFISIVLIIIVVLRFSSLRNEKEVDLYYALPISRKKIYLVHSLFGFIQLLVVWTVMFLLGFIMLLIMSQGYFREGFFILLYFIVLFSLAILYSVTSFVFLRAHTVFDGVTFILLFHILFLFISLFLGNNLIGFLNLFALNPFFSLTRWTMYLLALSLPDPSSYVINEFVADMPVIIFNTLFFIGLSIVCFMYNYKTIEQEKTENIGQISDSLFGYRLYIPLIMIFAISTIFFIGEITTWLLIGVFTSAGFIGFFVFRRTAKIKFIDIGYILIAVVIGVVLGIVFN